MLPFCVKLTIHANKLHTCLGSLSGGMNKVEVLSVCMICTGIGLLGSVPVATKSIESTTLQVNNLVFFPQTRFSLWLIIHKYLGKRFQTLRL